MPKHGLVDLDRISELLDVQHTQYDGYIASQCLFHDDDRPSLMIYPDRYNCKACSAWGYTDDLLRKLDVSSGTLISKPKKFVDFKNPFSKWTQNQTLSDALKVAWQNNKNNPSIYMTKERDIHPLDQFRFGIGLRDGWITFPIKDKYNKLVGAVARTLPDLGNSKYTVPLGQDPNLLYVPDWINIIEGNKLFITFGIIDALTLAIYGFPSASTTNGKQIDVATLYYMKKIMLFIPDKGEEKEANRIASQLDWRGKVLKVEYPDDCKDINDVHVKHPKLLEEMKKKWI
jgi:hypothetical protein